MQVQDAFIQKKLLYKFDKKIQLVFQSLFALAENSLCQKGDKMIDEAEENDKKGKYLSRQGILQQIQQLKFQNFKYRTALISAKKDQTSNQEILKKSQQQILQSKREVQTLSRELQHSLKCKRNKEEYNHLAQSLKQTFEPLSVQQQKLSTITREIQEMERKHQKTQLQYEKKQKCLKLALSALKSVLQNENTQTEATIPVNDSLHQASSLGSDPKISQQFSNSLLQNSEVSYEGREQGEQLEGGQIQGQIQY